MYLECSCPICAGYDEPPMTNRNEPPEIEVPNMCDFCGSVDIFVLESIGYKRELYQYCPDCDRYID